MIEFRFLVHPLVGFEWTYSYRQPGQSYLSCESAPFVPVGSPTVPCPYTVGPYSTREQEITGDWVFAKQTPRFTYFGLAGPGWIFTTGSDTASTGNLAYEYGGGADWKVRPRLGVRLQYRGEIYKVPSISPGYSFTTGWMHTAEPMIGLYYRWF